MDHSLEVELRSKIQVQEDMIIGLQQVVSLLGQSIFKHLPAAKNSYVVDILKAHTAVKENGRDSVATWLYDFGAGPLE
jgi:hypothetical protein